MSQENHTYCTFPWEMYSVDVGFGWWRPCPRIDYQKLEDAQFNNHKALVDLRKDLRNGIKNSLCNKCWKDEDQGIKSYRQVLKQDFKHPLISLDNIKAPKVFEIKFSNLCNLKCVFCSNRCSSLWEREQPIESSDYGSLHGDSVSELSLDYLKDNYNEIKVIQLFGGEPVLHKEFNQIIDLIKNAPTSSEKKTISFSTNLFFPENYRKGFEDNIATLLELGHKLYMRISIDGIKEQGEYLRTGLDWNVFEKNLFSFTEKFLDYPNLGQIKCNIALNITNLVYLDRIMEYLNSNNFNSIIPHYNYVGKPERFMLQSYGKRLSVARNIIEKQNFYSFNTYKEHVLSLIGSMENTEPDLAAIKDCKDWIDQYDLNRDTNFLDLFPDNAYMFEDL